MSWINTDCSEGYLHMIFSTSNVHDPESDIECFIYFPAMSSRISHVYIDLALDALSARVQLINYCYILPNHSNRPSLPLPPCTHSLWEDLPDRSNLRLTPRRSLNTYRGWNKARWAWSEARWGVSAKVETRKTRASFQRGNSSKGCRFRQVRTLLFDCDSPKAWQSCGTVVGTSRRKSTRMWKLGWMFWLLLNKSARRTVRICRTVSGPRYRPAVRCLLGAYAVVSWGFMYRCDYP